MKKKKVIKKEIVIIGGGASGLMSGVLLRNKGFVIIEKNYELAKKIKVSGGGRCNITNELMSFYNFDAKESFVKDIIKEFSPKELLSFFSDVEFVKRKKTQYFCKNSSNDVIYYLKNKIDSKKFFLGCEVTDVKEDKEGFFIKTDKADFLAKNLVVASGSLSFPQLGVSDIAYKIAKKFGHTVTFLKPALVGFTLQRDDFWMKKLAGISIPVNLTVNDRVYSGDILFAHRGISGPVILNASLRWTKGSISIDFLQGEKLKLKYPKKQISSNLSLPKRFVKEFLLNVGLEDKIVSKLSENEFKKLKILNDYKLAPAGDFGFKKAEVTKGGIITDEIDSKTMQSKLKKGLYFLGECLDVTGELGGYNLHFAFSSAKRLALI